MISRELEADLRTIGHLGYCFFNFKEFKSNLKILKEFMQSKEAKDMFKIIENEYNYAKKNIEKYNKLMEEGKNLEEMRK